MNKQLNLDIGSRVLELRHEKKLSRERLAELSEISTQFLADLESGKKGMSTATLYKLCNALCVSADYLLFGKTENKSHMYSLINSLTEKQQDCAEKIIIAFIDALKE